MKITNFNKGIISSTIGSFWWGVLGTYYFQYIAFVGTFEVVVHRCIWTSLMLLITTTFFNKWHLFKEIIINKKKLFVLFITSFLIFGNWTIWIYAVATNRIIDAKSPLINRWPIAQTFTAINIGCLIFRLKFDGK